MAREVYATVVEARVAHEMEVSTDTRDVYSCSLQKKNLKRIAMDILWPLPKTFQGIQCMSVITDRYYNLIKAKQTSETTASHVANLFLDLWIVPFGITTNFIIDNGPQFLRKFFQSVSRQVDIKHPTTTFYQPQTKAQAERFSTTIVTRLKHCDAGHQRNRHMLAHALTYANNTPVYRSKNMSPYSLALSRLLHRSSLLTASMNMPDGSLDTTSPQAMCAIINLRLAAFRS